jgi:hypothetical protein
MLGRPEPRTPCDDMTPRSQPRARADLPCQTRSASDRRANVDGKPTRAGETRCSGDPCLVLQVMNDMA